MAIQYRRREQMSKHIILGAAGAGKTFFLVKKVEELLNKGISSNRICFCTYTKAAAQEAIERVISKFNLDKKDLPLFGTIHSLCYKNFCSGSKVITEKQKKEFFELNKLDYDIIKGENDILTGEFNTKTSGNLLLTFYDILRINLCKNIDDFKNENDLKKAYANLKNIDLDFNSIFVSTFKPFEILQEYEKFKDDRGLVDFIDMLLLAYKNKFVINAKVLIVDEFQDLSPLQYNLYKLWCKNKDEVYISGDDSQCIYSFIGANAEFLLNETKHLDKANGDEEIILPKTYRMHSKINSHCTDYIEKNIRKDKHVKKEMLSHYIGGEIIEEYIGGNLSDTLKYIRSNKFTFVLFRTNYYKKVFINDVLIPNGIVYNEIRSQSLWNAHSVMLFNAIINLIEKKSLDALKMTALMDAIQFKLSFLKRGAKTKFKNKLKDEEYSRKDLLSLGFNESIFDFLSYDKIYSIFDIPSSLKDAFEAAPKKIITFPIRLKIGTIHSAKGKEADDVIIFKDVSRRIVNELRKSIDNFESEIRVFYVGQSRARERLVILRGGFQNSDKFIIP